MAKNSSKARQAKQAKRKAKSKQKQKQCRKEGISSGLKSMINSSLKNPIEFCSFNGELSTGMVSITIARTVGIDNILIGSFNIDLYCLGVKNTFINIVSREAFAESTHHYKDIPPESAKKMIEGAVEFATSCGFKPHAGFEQSFRAFESVDSSLSNDVYEYGMGGKPYYIQGPNDTSDYINKIIKTLEKNCGVNGEDFNATIINGDPQGFFD